MAAVVKAFNDQNQYIQNDQNTQYHQNKQNLQFQNNQSGSNSPNSSNKQNIQFQNNQNNQNNQNHIGIFAPGNLGYGISPENQQTFSQQYSMELADMCLRFEGLSVRKSNVQSLPSMMCSHIATIAQVTNALCVCVCVSVCFGCVGVGMFVCVSVGMFVCVGVGTFGCVDVGMFGCVGVGMFGCVGVGMFGCVGVGMFVCVGVGMFVCVGVGMFVCVGVGVFVCVGVCMFVCVVESGSVILRIIFLNINDNNHRNCDSILIHYILDDGCIHLKCCRCRSRAESVEVRLPFSCLNVLI